MATGCGFNSVFWSGMDAKGQLHFASWAGGTFSVARKWAALRLACPGCQDVAAVRRRSCRGQVSALFLNETKKEKTRAQKPSLGHPAPNNIDMKTGADAKLRARRRLKQLLLRERPGHDRSGNDRFPGFLAMSTKHRFMPGLAGSSVMNYGKRIHSLAMRAGEVH